MSKVPVANGFAGSHVLEASLECPGIEWIAACRDPSKLPTGFSGRVRSGDLRDADYRLQVLQDIDVVVHTAARTSLWGRRRIWNVVIEAQVAEMKLRQKKPMKMPVSSQ